MPCFTLDPKDGRQHMFVMPVPEKKPAPTPQEQWLQRTDAMFERQRQQRRQRRLDFFGIKHAA